MTIKSSLTPKDTEELRPNFFVQQRGETYRQVKPLVWNDEWRLKGQIGWQNVLMIVLMILLFYKFAGYVKFYEQFHSRPSEVCTDYITELASRGIFLQDFNKEVYNGNTFTLQINNKED